MFLLLAGEKMSSESDNRQVVRILYTNYRGETTHRRVIPDRIYFGSNEWHPEEQWLLDAYDLDKGARRAFAMKHIHEWES